MSLDDQQDVSLAAVAALVRGAITAELGEDFVAVVYNDPRPLQILASARLPALNIYCQRTTARRRNSTALVRDRLIQFDYVLPATSLERRSQRWPALEAAWAVITDALVIGSHVGVSSGADVLRVAGVGMEVESSMRADFGVADGGGETYPFMRGSAVLTFTPDEVDVATLNDFLQMHTTFNKLQPVSGANDDPLIELVVNFPAPGS